MTLGDRRGRVNGRTRNAKTYSLLQKGASPPRQARSLRGSGSLSGAVDITIAVQHVTGVALEVLTGGSWDTYDELEIV